MARPDVSNPFIQAAMRVAQAGRPRRPRQPGYEWRREEVPGRAMALLWFLTRGCRHDGCTMCDYGTGPRVGAAAMVTAVRTGLAELAGTGLGHLAVTPSGSMLDPAEVPPAARAAIFALLNEFEVPDLFFETRAETITEAAVAEVRAAFPKKRVGTTIGLETASAYLQRFAVNKGSHPSWVIRAIERLHAGGIGAMLDSGVGTPFLTPAEAIEDAVASVRWAIGHGADVAVLLGLATTPRPPRAGDLCRAIATANGPAYIEVTMSKVLVLFAHPALQKSRVNRRLMRAARQTEGITFHDLYELYPDFLVDVSTEQELLLAHDVIVLQHPFYWYSAPALVKEWQDLVLEHGWAYGHGGTALVGKRLLSAITTGGREDAYCPEGTNRFTMRQLLAPFDQTAHLCGMEYLPPFVVHGTHQLAAADIDRHAEAFRRVLVGLRDDTLDLVAARSHPRLNTDLDAVGV